MHHPENPIPYTGCGIGQLKKVLILVYPTASQRLTRRVWMWISPRAVKLGVALISRILVSTSLPSRLIWRSSLPAHNQKPQLLQLYPPLLLQLHPPPKLLLHNRLLRNHLLLLKLLQPPHLPQQPQQPQQIQQQEEQALVALSRAICLNSRQQQAVNLRPLHQQPQQLQLAHHQPHQLRNNHPLLLLLRLPHPWLQAMVYSTVPVLVTCLH